MYYDRSTLFETQIKVHFIVSVIFIFFAVEAHAAFKSNNLAFYALQLHSNNSNELMFNMQFQ